MLRVWTTEAIALSQGAIANKQGPSCGTWEVENAMSDASELVIDPKYRAKMMLYVPFRLLLLELHKQDIYRTMVPFILSNICPCM